jgi:hypothetical protein
MSNAFDEWKKQTDKLSCILEKLECERDEARLALAHVIAERDQLCAVCDELATGLQNHIWPTATGTHHDYNKAKQAIENYLMLPHVQERNNSL